MREFVPYGTPCNEPCEPDSGRMEALERQVAEMRAELAALQSSRLDEVPAELPLSGTGN